jgi:hypothetical protein
VRSSVSIVKDEIDPEIVGGVPISIVPGDIAPSYDSGTEVDLESVTITEEGSEAGLPLVDFRLRGPNDESFMVAIPGRVITGLAAAVRGINKRVHGKEEP